MNVTSDSLIFDEVIKMINNDQTDELDPLCGSSTDHSHFLFVLRVSGCDASTSTRTRTRPGLCGPRMNVFGLSIQPLKTPCS
jgi:hypothetical protein